MRGAMTGTERNAFLAEPHVAVPSVARDGDRRPHTTPVWSHHQPGGNVTFFTRTQGHRSRKADLIEQVGVVSLCIQQEKLPYTYVTIEAPSPRSTDCRPPSRPLPLFAVISPRSGLRASAERPHGVNNLN